MRISVPTKIALSKLHSIGRFELMRVFYHLRDAMASVGAMRVAFQQQECIPLGLRALGGGSLWMSWTLAILSLFEGSVAVAGSSCDYMIQTSPSSVPQKVDGATLNNGSAVQPGETVCIGAGDYDRGKLEFRNFLGTELAPIRIVNVDGIVNVVDGRLYLYDSQHVEFDGSGVPSETHGFRIYATAEEGFSIRQSVSGAPPILGIYAHHIEVFYRDHFGVQAVGVRNVEGVARPDPIQNVRLSHFYIHRGYDKSQNLTGGFQEGFYINSSKYDEGPVPQLSDIRLDHNVIVESGWDGLQVGAAKSGCEIDHNVIIRDSRYKQEHQNSGVMVAKGSSCNVHHNKVLGGNGPGIYYQGNGDQVGDKNASDGGHVYGNLVIPAVGDVVGEPNPVKPDIPQFTDERRFGIYVANLNDDITGADGYCYIYGNSIADTAVEGIWVTQDPQKIKGFMIFNNLLVETADGVTPAVGLGVMNNLRLSRAEGQFSPAEEIHGEPSHSYDGLRLTEASSDLIDAGVSMDWALMTKDIDGQSSPFGGSTDIGADEWREGAVWMDGFEE